MLKLHRITLLSALPAIFLPILMAVSPVAGAQAIEEVVVTAQKREQSLQDVSVAVTAVSGKDLVDLGVADAFRLDVLAPGLQLGLSGNDPRPALRGARTQQVEANDVAVSFYSDGLYRPRHGQALAGFVDVDRVEVLRGPQGTLFGRNSFGGLIHVISNKPDFNEVDYGAAVTGGDYEQIRGEGFINVPLGEKAAFRVAGVREHRDPYVKNITLGDKGGLKDADTTYIRGLLSVAPSDAVDVNLRAEYWEDDSNGNGSFGYFIEGIPVNLETGLTNGVSGTLRPRIGRSDECAGTCGRYGAGFDSVATPGPDNVAPTLSSPYRIADDTVPVRDLEEVTLAGDASMDFGFATLKVTLAYMDYEEYRWADCDLSAYPTLGCGNDITSETTQQEVQLTSRPDSRLQWVAGMFFLQEDLTNAFLWQDIHVSLINNAPDPNAAPVNQFASWASQIQVDSSSSAAYGQASFSMTDNMRILGGLRYTYDERDWQIYSQNPDDLSRVDFSVLNVLDTRDGEDVTTADRSWSKVTWKAGAELDLGDNSMVYATVSTGFLAGNQQGAFNGADYYDEQTVIAYEIGSKNLFAGGRLLFNASLYYNEYEDLLATRFVDTGVTTLAFTDNAGEVDAYGAELEIDWAATEQLQLGARIAVQDVEYGNFVLPNVYQEGGETISGIDNLFQLDGLQVQNSPDITATLLGSYNIDLGSMGSLRPAFTVYISDDYRADDSPWSYGNQDSFTKTDLSLTWTSSNQDWGIRAFVHNVEDEAVLLKATRFGGDVAITDYGPPRTWGVTLRYRY